MQYYELEESFKLNISGIDLEEAFFYTGKYLFNEWPTM